MCAMGNLGFRLMKKSRFFFLHPDTNPGKLEALNALYGEYLTYLRACVQHMLLMHRSKVLMSEQREFFPVHEALSSQIRKNAQAHAVAIVSGWAAAKYERSIKREIKTLFRAGKIDETTRKALCVIGKCSVDKPSGCVTQGHLDLYWALLLDEAICGRKPEISDRTGMRLTEMTCVFDASWNTQVTSWWLAFSHLKSGKARIQLPLAANPYVTHASQVGKGFLARRLASGSWRFEVVEKEEFEIQGPTEHAPKVGVDVGLNALAATSHGGLFGTNLKPKFDRRYTQLQSVRANRQRQDLKENSKRLVKLETKLSGLTKTATGTVANQLVKAYPSHVFVLEDLDLRGTRGSKRFAYRALATNLERKVPTLQVNAAYSSQMCPSCGHTAKENRKGTKFACKSCGRKSHADVVGGVNLLGRSEDKQIGLVDYPSRVKSILRERYLVRRNSSLGWNQKASAPSDLKLTVGVLPLGETRIASNQGVS